MLSEWIQLKVNHSTFWNLWSAVFDLVALLLGLGVSFGLVWCGF